MLLYIESVDFLCDIKIIVLFLVLLVNDFKIIVLFNIFKLEVGLFNRKNFLLVRKVFVSLIFCFFLLEKFFLFFLIMLFNLLGKDMI